MRARGLAALAFLAGAIWAVPASAGRFIATPMADVLPGGRYSLWQFALYEARSTKNWRTLNRLDLGLGGGAELGVFVINPEDKPADTWVNLQYTPLKEGARLPSLSLGAWDVFRKSHSWFADEGIGASPFLSAAKTLKGKDKRYLKLGLSYGFNRLHGLFGGFDLRFLEATGLMLEHSPKNLRLPRADAWDFGVYQWLGPFWRARVCSVGGNPMADVFFTYAFGAK